MEIETREITKALVVLESAGHGAAAQRASAEIEALKLRLARAEYENPNTRSTLRAHFASKALEGMIARGADEWSTRPLDMARGAWSFADAMLETRDERKPVDVAALVEKLRAAVLAPEFPAREPLLEDLIALVGDVKGKMTTPTLDTPAKLRAAIAALNLDLPGGRGFTTDQVVEALRLDAQDAGAIEEALLALDFERHLTPTAGGARRVWRRK